MIVPVPASSRSSARASYHLDQLHVSWWFRAGAFQTRNRALLVRDYFSAKDGYSDEDLDTTFFVYSYKQLPLQGLPRNFLLERLTDNETRHYGTILVFKLDKDYCIQNLRRSDFGLMTRVVFR